MARCEQTHGKHEVLILIFHAFVIQGINGCFQHCPFHMPGPIQYFIDVSFFLSGQLADRHGELSDFPFTVSVLAKLELRR